MIRRPLTRAGRVDDQPTQRELDRIVEALREVQGVPLLDGKLLSDLDLTTTAQSFAHGLGRRWRGYIVIARDANAIIYHATASQPTKEISLRASATVTASLWVF